MPAIFGPFFHRRTAFGAFFVIILTGCGGGEAPQAPSAATSAPASGAAPAASEGPAEAPAAETTYSGRPLPAAMIPPAFRDQMNRCRANLMRIAVAKSMWSRDAGAAAGAVPKPEDLVAAKPGYLEDLPRCPSGGHAYNPGPAGAPPTCGSGLPGHQIQAAEVR